MPGNEDLGRAVLELVTDPAKLRAGLSMARQESLSTLTGIQGQLKQIGSSMTATGSRLTIGVTAPVLALGKAITGVAIDFDTALNQVVGLTAVTRDEIGGVRDEILALGKEVGKTPQELAEAFYFVASAGFAAGEAMDVLRVAAMASAAGLGATQDIAKVLGLTINAYGRENINAAQAADILVAAVRDGTAEASAFASVLGRVVPTASVLGVTFDQVTGSLAAMTLSGLSADEAATSLNQVLVSLLKPTQQAETALAGMGLSAEGLRKQLREQGLLAVLGTLEKAFAGNDEAASSVFGNVRALRGVLSLLTLDSAQLAAVFDDTANATGNLATGFAETEGPARDLARAHAELDEQMIELGRDVVPVLVGAVKALAGTVRDVVTWFRSLPDPVREGIVQFLGLAAAIGPILIVTGALVSSLGALVGAFKVVALTWIPRLIGALGRLSLAGAWAKINAAAGAAQAAAGGIQAIGGAAAGAAGPLVILAAAIGAVLIAYNNIKSDIDEQASVVSEDVERTIRSGVIDRMLIAKAALEQALREFRDAQAGPLGTGSPLMGAISGALSADARAQLEADLAAVNAAIERSMGEQRQMQERSRHDAKEYGYGLGRDYRAAGGAVTDYQETVKKTLAEAIADQRAFAADILASVRKFRTDLESAFGAVKDAELDMSDTVLRIAQKQAELAALDAETSAKIKKGTSIQSLEYRNRKEHILAELSELKLHAALIGDDMHKATALVALITGNDMAEGLTSPLPEVAAAYEQLRDDALLALIDLQRRGGPAGLTAAEAIADLFDPANKKSPFYGIRNWGNATIRAWIAGIIASLKAGYSEVKPYVGQFGKAFVASSPPGPESPLHLIDVWGERTGLAWVGGIISAIRSGVGMLASPLSALGDPFRAMTLPALGMAAAGIGPPGGVLDGRAMGTVRSDRIGPINITVDARGARDPEAVGRSVADAMVDALREQAARL